MENQQKKKILLTGGTGLVGQMLVPYLEAVGHQVSVLTRNPRKEGQYYWDPLHSKVDEKALNGVDTIIHLAGAGIAEKRWTAARKCLLEDSRVLSAQLLLKKLQEKGQRISCFISASGVNIYGTQTSARIFNESDAVAHDFLGTLCQRWETTADAFKPLSDRVVKLRIGLVLSNRGGVLPRVVAPTRWGIDATLGSGHQWMPWIHEEDLCRVIIRSLSSDFPEGIYNAVAPEHTTNRQLTGLTAKTLGKRQWLPPAPAFIIRLLFGEMASILLEGSRISSEKLEQVGFGFKHPSLKEALGDLGPKK